jgi:hypothetical protein
MPPLWLIKLAGVLLALVLATGYGYRHGAARVQAKWDKAAAEQLAQVEAERESSRLRAQAAATTYETQRAAIARRPANPSQESVYALRTTICPPPGALGRPLELGDVPIPGAQLDRLRDAGADYTSGH